MVDDKKPLTSRQRLVVRIEQTKVTIASVERHLAAGRDKDALGEVRFAAALLVGARGELEEITANGPTPYPQRRWPAQPQPPDDGD